MGLDHFKVIFIDGQLFEELPASFFVMAYHQASQQQLNITDSLNKYLSKLFGLFFHLNALNAYFFHFFFRSFELFPYGTNSGLIEHNIGYVFNGLSFKLYHNKWDEVHIELFSEQIEQLLLILFSQLLFLVFGKRLLYLRINMRNHNCFIIF